MSAAATTQTENKAITPPVAQAKAETKIVVHDETNFANLLDTGRFEHMWRVAQIFAKTQLVPQCFQNRPEDCFIVIQMAVRLGVDPFALLQRMYVVQGKPGMEAQMAISLVNTSGLFVDSIDYEIEGENPKDEDYRVRAFAVRKTTGKRIDGPWIDWPLVNGEGWSKKNGSKWLTMPGQMFCYRAATFFARLHCPERLAGMTTVDEVEDIGPGIKVVENTAALPSSEETAREAVKRAAGRTAESKPTEPAPEPSKPTETADEAPGRQEETKPEVIERREKVLKDLDAAKQSESKPATLPICSPAKKGCVPDGSTMKVNGKSRWVCANHHHLFTPDAK